MEWRALAGSTNPSNYATASVFLLSTGIFGISELAKKSSLYLCFNITWFNNEHITVAKVTLPKKSSKSYAS